MNEGFDSVTRLAGKGGVLGAVVSAMGCAMCFPALASLGAAIGLGFLSRWEGLFVHVLLPLFALVALVANALAWVRHRQRYRGALGVIGPGIVLVDTLLLLGHGWSAPLFYVGLALMVVVSIWDLVSPAARRCETSDRELPPSRA